MLTKFQGVHRQLTSVDYDELLSCLKKYHSTPELSDVPCTTQNFSEYLEYEFGIADYIGRNNKFLRNILTYLERQGLLIKITETGNGEFVRRFIWSPIIQ